MGISFETFMNLLILFSIGVYHVLEHYFRQKNAVNIQSDVYTIEDRLKEWSRLTLTNIQYAEILEKKIQLAVKAAIINCNLPKEAVDDILASIEIEQKPSDKEIYANLEEKETVDFKDLQERTAKNILRSLLKNRTHHTHQ